jgi:hypothetical protein
MTVVNAVHLTLRVFLALLVSYLEHRASLEARAEWPFSGLTFSSLRTVFAFLSLGQGAAAPLCSCM